jgi:hypothetical protein
MIASQVNGGEIDIHTVPCTTLTTTVTSTPCTSVTRTLRGIPVLVRVIRCSEGSSRISGLIGAHDSLLRLDGESREPQRSVNENLTLNHRSRHRLDTTPQPLTNSDQALGVVLLLSDAGGALHHAQSQRRHFPVDPRQLRQQLTILPDHRTSL